MCWAADAVEEFGLQKTGDAEGGRGESYAKGGVGANEEVLIVCVSGVEKTKVVDQRSQQHRI